MYNFHTTDWWYFWHPEAKDGSDFRNVSKKKVTYTSDIRK